MLNGISNSRSFILWEGVLGLALGLGAGLAAPAGASDELEFNEETEQVINLRSAGSLELSNSRGDIAVEGWAQDKVRLKVKKRAIAATDDEARRLFSSLDVRHRMIDGNVELLAEYGRGLSLEERLRERRNPRTRMEIAILAPVSRPLRIWTLDGKVTLKNWRGAVEIRSGSGSVQVESFRGESLSVYCPSCSIRLDSVNGSVRCIGGSGSVTLRQVSGPHVYVESASGGVSAEGVAGEQLYVTQTAQVNLRKARGQIEFHTREGAVSLVEGNGSVSGRTRSGDISVKMLAWEAKDKSLVESASGDIDMDLPITYAGEVDARSGKGELEIGFPLLNATSRPGVTGKHMNGVVGGGGEILRIQSEQGAVKVTRLGQR